MRAHTALIVLSTFKCITCVSHSHHSHFTGEATETPGGEVPMNGPEACKWASVL